MFVIGNEIVNNVDRVCYLGSMLTPSGKFEAMLKFLYGKACRALIYLRSTVRKVPDLSINTQIKLFDSMIKPILLYKSVFWGAFLHKNFGNNFMNFTYAASQDMNSYVGKFHSKYVNESCMFTEKLITMLSDANWEKLPCL